MSKNFGFYFNGSDYDGINADQMDNYNRFTGIMQQIQDVAYATKTNWTGAGRQSHDDDECEFDLQCGNVMDAFSRLIGNSEEAGQGFRKMMGNASQRFE